MIAIIIKIVLVLVTLLIYTIISLLITGLVLLHIAGLHTEQKFTEDEMKKICEDEIWNNTITQSIIKFRIAEKALLKTIGRKFKIQK